MNISRLIITWRVVKVTGPWALAVVLGGVLVVAPREGAGEPVSSEISTLVPVGMSVDGPAPLPTGADGKPLPEFADQSGPAPVEPAPEPTGRNGNPAPEPTLAPAPLPTGADGRPLPGFASKPAPGAPTGESAPLPTGPNWEPAPEPTGNARWAGARAGAVVGGVR
ncbi:hypothetical protein GCM10010156_76550 [Planobispora rosea]|uniref:Uncharacterized protein n=1 Tax=Planobispora rosea TaxID=35762 RepID=A0A8J3WH48_PLARO|nr:hypothetical protein [Planobispora rosea]GGT08161.1 hypothetical protein GCM10010156_76550 [Planobispora rosea]GIH89133.1 hypothetical protein Pro02_75410 [Planobispora rosea]